MENSWLQALDDSLARFNRSRDRVTYEAGRAKVLDVLADETGAADPATEARLIYLCRSGDGYIREAAVRQLGKKGCSADAWQVLIERQNDWVPQVRQAAQASAGMFLKMERLPVVLAALDAVVRLTRKSRTDHNRFVDQVGAFLDQPEHRSAVFAHFRKSRGPVASFLLSRMLCWPEAAQAEVVRLSPRAWQGNVMLWPASRRRFRNGYVRPCARVVIEKPGAITTDCLSRWKNLIE